MTPIFEGNEEGPNFAAIQSEVGPYTTFLLKQLWQIVVAGLNQDGSVARDIPPEVGMVGDDGTRRKAGRHREVQEITEHIGGEGAGSVDIDTKVDDGSTYGRTRQTHLDDGRPDRLRKPVGGTDVTGDEVFDKNNDDSDDITEDSNKKFMGAGGSGRAEVRDHIGGDGVANLRDAADAILVDVANAELENILALATMEFTGSPSSPANDVRAGAVRALNALSESSTPILLTAITEGTTPANDGVSDTGVDVTDGSPGTIDADSGTGFDGGGGPGGDPNR